MSGKIAGMGKDICVFCDISEGRSLASRVFETAEVLAFLDNRPLFPGHVLIIPRAHVDSIFDLPRNAVPPLFDAVHVLSSAVRDALGCDGVFVASNNGVSQSVAHLHVHVVPRNKKDGLRGFMWPRHRYESDLVMEQMAERIKSAVKP